MGHESMLESEKKKIRE